MYSKILVSNRDECKTENKDINKYGINVLIMEYFKEEEN